jgi:hypothetical protein
MGHGVQAFYSCGTVGCNGRGAAIWYGLGMLVLFDGPLVDGYYRIPAAAGAWIDGTRRVLQTADINECIHGGKEPPDRIMTVVAPDDGSRYFVAYKGPWCEVAPGLSVDMEQWFAERVRRGREAVL